MHKMYVIKCTCHPDVWFELWHPNAILILSTERLDLTADSLGLEPQARTVRSVEKSLFLTLPAAFSNYVPTIYSHKLHAAQLKFGAQ